MNLGRRTPLFEKHKNLGAKMTLFAGWEMPLSYGSIINEHQSVRHKSGLFDISHMGKLLFQGPEVASQLERVFSRRLTDLKIGCGRYGLLLSEAGTVVDDIIIYRISQEEFLAIVNAARISNNISHIHNYCDIEILDKTETWGALALQGPEAISLWQKICNTTPPSRFQIREYHLGQTPGFVARTGYTGEDGVEILASPSQIQFLWDQLLNLGAQPCGLGARDSLRIEAGYPLYGHELSENLTAIESAAERAIDFTKNNDWLGKDILLQQKTHPPPRKLVFIRALQPGVLPRQGCCLFYNNQNIGSVTSGVFSPTFQCGIGMAIVDTYFSNNECEVLIEIRTRRDKVRIEKKPLYRTNRP